MDKDNRYFKTANFYLAVFLFSKGLELANIDKLNSKQAQFVFIDIPARELLVNEFNFSQQNSHMVLVDARVFINSIKTLKDKLYQQVF